MKNFFDRSFTVYDSMLDTGEILNGGYIVAAVFASKADSTRAGSVIRNLNGGEGKRETSGARRRVLLVPPLNQTGYGGGY